MTTFITGGTGQTGSNLAKLLHAAQQPVLIASRSGSAPAPFTAVKFDWFDASTFAAPFDADPTINKVYLLGPTAFDALTVVKPFIDLAIQRGVTRFVLLSATSVNKGVGPAGKIHEYLDSIGVEYVALRPTWFAENFGGPLYLQSIREGNEIYSAAEDGKVAFVAVKDIAQVAYDAIRAEKIIDNEVFIVGPELFTHDQAAALLSDVLGRPISHKRLSQKEFSGVIQSAGAPAEYGDLLATLQGIIATGFEEGIFTQQPKKTFKGKITVREYLEANKALWIKS